SGVLIFIHATTHRSFQHISGALRHCSTRMRRGPMATGYGEVPDRPGLLLDVLDSLTDNVAVWDDQLRLVYANRALCTLWGASEADFVGKGLRELPFSTVDPETVERPLRQVLESGRTVAGGFPYQAGSERRYAEFICTPVMDAGGRVAYV